MQIVRSFTFSIQPPFAAEHGLDVLAVPQYVSAAAHGLPMERTDIHEWSQDDSAKVDDRRRRPGCYAQLRQDHPPQHPPCASGRPPAAFFGAGGGRSLAGFMVKNPFGLSRKPV